MGQGWGQRWGRGREWVQGQGQSRDAVCPCVSVGVQGRLGCTAPEGRPPSFLVRAFLLSAARRVGRRSGNAIGDGGWAPDCEREARLEGEHTLQRSWGCGAHPEENPVHGCLALAGASLALRCAGDRAGLAAASDQGLATF